MEAPRIELPEIENAEKQNQWILETIRPYITSPALEIGSGQGTFSTLFAQQGIRIHLSDPSKDNRDILRAKFAGIEHIRFVHAINTARPDFERVHHSILGSFNTVIAVSVKEYNDLTRQIFANLALLLPLEGLLVFLAPAPTVPYNDFEADLDVWKGYNRRSLNNLLGDQFDILETKYLNIVSAPESDLQRQPGLSILAVVQKK